MSRWRYRCPKGHANIRVRTGDRTVYCDTCRRSYARRLDAKRGILVRGVTNP